MRTRLLATTVAILVLSPLAPPAVADSNTLEDPGGDVSARGWDVRSLSYAHTDGGRLVHRLRLRGPWDPSALERSGKTAMRFVFAPGASDGWRYAVQVFWNPREKRLVGALLDLSKDDPFQKEIRVRRFSDGVQVRLHKWDLNRPRSYALGAFTAVEAQRKQCDEGFSDGTCRDSVGFSGNFVHSL